MKTGLKYTGYTLYALSAAVLLLYVHFPSEAVQSYLTRAGARMNPPVVFKTGALHLIFPPGLKAENVAVSLEKSPEIAFEARGLSLSPGFGALLLGDIHWWFHAGAYGGVIQGRILPGKGGDMDDLSLSFKDVRIHEITALPRFGGELSGKLSGNVAYRGPFNEILRGEGGGNIHVTEGKIDLSPPFLGLETLAFGELKGKFTLKKRTLHLASVSLDGKGFQGSLSGTVYLNRLMDRSRLNLKGSIEPIADYLETLKGGPALLSLFKGGRDGIKRAFVIQGTFRAPKFRFL